MYKSIEIYFQAIIFISIRMEYSVLILAIQKNEKNKKTNLVKAILQIIKHLKFIEGNKKVKVMQTTMLLIYCSQK